MPRATLSLAPSSGSSSQGASDEGVRAKLPIQTGNPDILRTVWGRALRAQYEYHGLGPPAPPTPLPPPTHASSSSSSSFCSTGHGGHHRPRALGAPRHTSSPSDTCGRTGPEHVMCMFPLKPLSTTLSSLGCIAPCISGLLSLHPERLGPPTRSTRPQSSMLYCGDRGQPIVPPYHPSYPLTAYRGYWLFTFPQGFLVWLY